MLTQKTYGSVLVVMALLLLAQTPQALISAERLELPLEQVEGRLDEESETGGSEPNSLTFRRAVGQLPARAVEPRQMKAKRTLTLEQCLQLAFLNSNEIKQEREQILSVGGSKLIANSRFLPTIEIISQYEHFRDFTSADADAGSVGATISQRIFEYGKDNPIDVDLRAEQRNALFNYENRVATVFSQVRRAFLFVKLKERQITTREDLLAQFEKQSEIKQQRMDANNLSVKWEVLTAKLNVLNEQMRINTLKRQRFNRKMDLLRLIGLPVGADQVEFEGQMDSFGLDTFDTEGMIRLALAQSSEVALVEALVSEQHRTMRQLRYEYLPDLRFSAGYQDKAGKVGADLTNRNDTWGLDVIGQPMIRGANEGQGLGLFGNEVTLGGPDPGWFAGVQARLPVFEGKARTGRRIEARAALNVLKAALEDQKDRVELGVRQSYKFLSEQAFQVKLEQENVSIERERFSIKEKLRDVGKITDDELETFRRSFFAAQDNLFRQQEIMIERQEDLRLAIRYFSPDPAVAAQQKSDETN